MLSKIQATVMLLIATGYGLIEIWDVIFNVPQGLLETFVSVVFSIIAVFWTGAKTVKAFKFNVTSADFTRILADKR